MTDKDERPFIQITHNYLDNSWGRSLMALAIHEQLRTTEARKTSRETAARAELKAEALKHYRCTVPFPEPHGLT